MRNSVLAMVVFGAMLLIVISCAADLVEGQNPGECEDGADNDEDGLFDCADPDCIPAPACAGDDDDTIADDDDTIADDDDTDPGDDDTDHGDDDSAGPDDDDDSSGPDPGDDDDTANPGEWQAAGDCTDGLDNDGDGLTDCQDPDCGDDNPECDEGDDDDSAGDDDDSGPGELDCDNTLDDDSDGLADCDDSDCAADPNCQTPSAEICDNTLDDDLDTYIDCLDSDCTAAPACGGSGSVFAGSEVGTATCTIGSGTTNCVLALGNPVQGGQNEISPADIDQIGVLVNTTHGAVGELTFSVTGSDTQTFELVTAGQVSGTDFVDTMFVDNMSCNGTCPSISQGSPPYTGDHSPEGFLSGWNGANINGDWTLNVTNTGSTTSGSVTWAIWAVYQ